MSHHINTQEEIEEQRCPRTKCFANVACSCAILTSTFADCDICPFFKTEKQYKEDADAADAYMKNKYSITSKDMRKKKLTLEEVRAYKSGLAKS